MTHVFIRHGGHDFGKWNAAYDAHPRGVRSGENDHDMKSSISYKSCLIRGESFQPKKGGEWVPQYTLRRQDTKNKLSDFLSHQAQLDKTFPRESAADHLALQEAMKWIDEHEKVKS
jgi:hypothetical protein